MMSGGISREMDVVHPFHRSPMKYALHNQIHTEVTVSPDYHHASPQHHTQPSMYLEENPYHYNNNNTASPKVYNNQEGHYKLGKSHSVPCTPVKYLHGTVKPDNNDPCWSNGLPHDSSDDATRPLQRSSSYDALGTLPRSKKKDKLSRSCDSASLAKVLELHRTIAKSHVRAYREENGFNAHQENITYCMPQQHHPSRTPPHQHHSPMHSNQTHYHNNSHYHHYHCDEHYYQDNDLHPLPPQDLPLGRSNGGRTVSGVEILQALSIPEEDSGFSQTSTPPSEPGTPHSVSSDGSTGTPGGTPRSTTSTSSFTKPPSSNSSNCSSSSAPTGNAIRFNLDTISEGFGSFSRNAAKRSSDPDILSSTRRSRSQSLFANLSQYRQHHSDDDSDGANDDYGFLPYYNHLNPSVPASAMHKSPAQANRVLPKKWRKSKLLAGRSIPASSWKPEGSCVWSSSAGRRVVLGATSLLHVSEVERIALQKLALARLQAMELGVNITIPKDGIKRSKRAFLLRRRTNSSSLLDTLKDRGKDGKEGGCVFGIPLAKCIANDVELRRRKPSSLRERRESLDIPPLHTRKSSSSSVSEACVEGSDPHSSTLGVVRSISYPTGAASSDSLSESDSRASSSRGSNLLDALSLSASSKLGSPSWQERKLSVAPHTPQIPYIANACFKHLETYGLRVLGIFRIGSSKKRLRQLREEFDTGKDVKLNEEHNPHDVGGLLKEFFRDLPDPLLTRDLYSAFVATRKISSHDQRILALHRLVALLPVPNRDTLWALLRFLYLVVQHSTDTMDVHGQLLQGNKMDGHNLATLFGPNILHKAKGGLEYEVETLERANERQEVISVVKEMLEYHHRIFEITAELHDEVYHLLNETNPEAVDLLLKRKSTVMGIEIDPETSSSFYEESDSSSIPRSPSCGSETDPTHPRTLSEALSMQSPSPSHQHVSRVHSMENPPVQETLRIPKFQLSCPDQGWYRPDRSPSPHSPRISPSPKALKSATPTLRLRGTADSPERSHPLVSPRPIRWRKSEWGSSHSPTPSPSTSLPPSQTAPSFLTVPSLKRERDSSSMSSLSSYYPSSRSATNSPVIPGMSPSPSPRGHSGWYLDPQSTPSSNTLSPSPVKAMSISPRELTPEPAASPSRTSSTQRPLGFNLPRTSMVSSTSSAPTIVGSGGEPTVSSAQDWQKERWKHWEKIAQEHSEEQETLV